MPKIISFDIETSHLEADFGRVLNFAWKELGKPARVLNLCDYKSFKIRPWDDSPIIKDAAKILDSADIVVSYYGKGFDWGFLNARLMYHGLPLLVDRTNTHVDLYFTVRRLLRISSRGMGNVADQLRLPDRKMYVEHAVWVKASAGHRGSIHYLGERCKSDVCVLEDAYARLRGSVRLHPSVSGRVGPCRYCGSPDLQRRGYQLTTRAKKARVQCKNCSAWDTRAIPA